MSEQGKVDWDALINGQQGAYGEAEEFDDWLPPIGLSDLHAIVTNVVCDTFQGKEDKKTYPYWRVTGTLLDGVDPTTNALLAKRTFTLAFCSTGPSPASAGQLKGFARWLAGGQPVEDIKVADQLIRGAVGKYQFTFDMKASRKGNAYVKVTACQELAPVTT